MNRLRNIFLMLMAMSTIAFATMPVYDPMNYVLALEQKLNQINMIENQVKGYQNQIMSLQNQAKQLATLDRSLSVNSLQSLQHSLHQIIQLNNSTKSVIKRSEDLSNKFLVLFPQNPDTSMSVADLNNKSKVVADELNNSVYDALNTSLVDPDKYNNDYERINALVESAGNSEGSLQALQSANQIAGLSAGHLMELKQLQAQEIKLLGTIEASKQEKERIHKETKKKLMDEYLIKNRKESETGNLEIGKFK